MKLLVSTRGRATPISRSGLGFSFGLNLAFVLGVLAGCGSVGEPLPPLLNVPGKVLDFRVTQLAGEAELRWTWPPLTTEGMTLRDVERFEVRALDIPEGAGAPPVDAFDQLGTTFALVEGDALPDDGPGSPVVLRASLEQRFGKRTAFAVRGVSSRGRASEWSDFVVRQALRPAEPPATVQAESIAEGVRLEWAATEGAERYVVERRLDEVDSYQKVSTINETRYLDSAVPAEGGLFYRVRSQVGPEADAVDSEASSPARVERKDVFPPAAPTGLRAVATQNAVEVTWSPVPDPALAGYEVLRNGEPAHDGLVDAPAFRDESPQQANEYRVRAIDARGNRSEPSAPATANLP